ncbi:hypothetical protein COBT_001947 [Conglomerata obtusa]
MPTNTIRNEITPAEETPHENFGSDHCIYNMPSLHQRLFDINVRQGAQQDIDEELNKLSDEEKKLFKDGNFSDCYYENALIYTVNGYIDLFCDKNSAKIPEKYKNENFASCYRVKNKTLLLKNKESKKND